MSRRFVKFVGGFTVVEVLLGLAITALLLVAVAVALNASAINYNENKDVFRTINSERQALTRMTTQLRTAEAVNPDAPVNECTFDTAGGDNITYHYNQAEQKLYLITNDDLSDSDYVLCDNVTAMSFNKSTFIDEHDQIRVKSVQICMTVASGGVEQTISAATVIRRNLK